MVYIVTNVCAFLRSDTPKDTQVLNNAPENLIGLPLL